MNNTLPIEDETWWVIPDAGIEINNRGEQLQPEVLRPGAEPLSLLPLSQVTIMFVDLQAEDPKLVDIHQILVTGTNLDTLYVSIAVPTGSDSQGWVHLDVEVPVSLCFFSGHLLSNYFYYQDVLSCKFFSHAKFML